MSNATRQNLVLTENGLGIEIHGHKAGGVNELLDPGTDGTHGLLLVKTKKQGFPVVLPGKKRGSWAFC